ncbi:MAG: hypothetical protein U0270_17750 [Labilithrix sp.]
MAPKNATRLPTTGDLPKTWEAHVAVEMKSGEVLDPLLNQSFPSADAWQKAIVGNSDVLISRSPYPPIVGSPLPGDGL